MPKWIDESGNATKRMYGTASHLMKKRVTRVISRMMHRSRLSDVLFTRALSHTYVAGPSAVWRLLICCRVI